MKLKKIITKVGAAALACMLGIGSIHITTQAADA